MSLSVEIIQAIDAALADAGVDHATIAHLKRLSPNVSVTRCDAVDVRDETPFRAYVNCNLFLIDGRNHCWKITQDVSSATGLVLAPKGNQP